MSSYNVGVGGRGMYSRQGLTRSALVCMVAALLVMLPASAGAVQLNFPFELDGNAVVNHAGSGLPDDWSRIWSGPNGATASSFLNGPTDDSFVKGSKDVNDLNTWSWRNQSVPDDDQITDAFAAAYVVPSGPDAGNRALYFGMDRYATNGDADAGFWFLQPADGFSMNSDGSFSGHHTNGDLFVTSSFTNGGTTSTITVYRWNSAAPNNLQLVSTGTPCTADFVACSVVNTGGITVPWPYDPKFGPNGTVLANGFLEGGIDLDRLFGTHKIPCFSSYVGETRASQEAEAELKGLVAGSIPTCGALTTDASGPVPVGATIRDTATLTNVYGTPAASTVTFNVYAGSDANCSTPLNASPIVTAATGTSSGNPTYTSAAFTTTNAGSYKWIATFAGDANNFGFHGQCNDADETSVVQQPSISITKNPKSQTVNTGQTATFTIVVTNTGPVTLTNVRVTDSLAPGCAKTSSDIAALVSMAPSATVTYTCTLANVTSSFTNSATATGTPVGGGPDVTATDTAPVTVVAPSIAITKSPDSQTVNSGQTATFTIVVTNDGQVTLSNVHVTDALAPGCARTSSDIAALASMAPSATVTYTCTLANVTASFTNIATATGTPVGGGPDVTATDTASVTVVVPGISITKNPKSQTINTGSTATFTIVVTNTGAVTLTNVHVTDAQAPGCAKTSSDIAALASMAPSASVTYTCSLANVTSSFVNSATVTGTPSGGGGDLTATDTAPVTVVAPSIAITKNPKSQTISSGTTATFTIVVTNTGPVTLSNVHVTDALAPGCAKTSSDIPALASMAPSATVSYTCTLANVTSSFTNSATATGTPVGGGADVTATDTAPVTVVVPGISITKNPKSQTVNKGATATFSIVVTNTGQATLSNVRVTDALAPGCARTSTDIPALASMAPSASVSYTCTLPSVTAGLTNSATATGTPVTGGPDVTATDTAPVTVVVPSIAVTKNPKSQTISSGGTASFTIVVTNNGPVALSNVRVTDAQAPGCAKTSADVPGLASMAPAAVVTYTCTLANVTSSFTNSVTATGTPVGGGPDVSDTDTAPVTVTPPASPPGGGGGGGGTPAISITKNPKSQTISSGGTAIFTIVVTNTGTVTLSNVRVTDQLSPDCAKTSANIGALGSLAPGASVTYNCSIGNVTAGFTNVATATGTPPSGNDVSASDSAPVTVTPPLTPPPARPTPTKPAIDIVKSPNTQTIGVGGKATFEITVTNIGDVTLSNVTVSDPKSPGCDRDLGTLAVGQSKSYTCTKDNVSAAFQNVATATGKPPTGATVQATDNANIKVKAFVPPQHPKIAVAKNPNDQTVTTQLKTTSTGANGAKTTVTYGTASFKVKVTNKGDVTLHDVTVSDPLSPNCNKDLGTIAAHKSKTYDCTKPAVTANFTNVATASGTSPKGVKVHASDTANVKVTTKTTSTSGAQFTG